MDEAYLVLVLEYQYVFNRENNSTHISILEMNVGMVDMHTFYYVQLRCYCEDITCSQQKKSQGLQVLNNFAI